MSLRVAINGFGRIGRSVLRAALSGGHGDIEIVGEAASKVSPATPYCHP